MNKKLDSMSIILPPSIYNRTFISKQINCFWRSSFHVEEIDLNHSFDLELLNENYSEIIWYNARKNLMIASNNNLSFVLFNAYAERALAYEIIQKNRESRGYPLRMTKVQVFETIQIIPSDFFILYNNSKARVASAIVFHITSTIVQVIYWGDLPGFTELKPMNFIVYKVFEYYKPIAEKVVDIGPSTENSIPNYGLCEYKESIGCSISPKYKLSKNIN